MTEIDLYLLPCTAHIVECVALNVLYAILKTVWKAMGLVMMGKNHLLISWNLCCYNYLFICFIFLFYLLFILFICSTKILTIWIAIWWFEVPPSLSHLSHWMLKLLSRDYGHLELKFFIKSRIDVMFIEQWQIQIDYNNKTFVWLGNFNIQNSIGNAQYTTSNN